MKPKKLEIIKSIKSVLPIVLFLAICLGALIAYSNIPPQLLVGSRCDYKCDGENVTIRCGRAVIQKGGVWLSDCENNEERFCQTVHEYC